MGENLKFDHIDITIGTQVKQLPFKEKRDCFCDLDAFMNRHELHYGKVCALYGLRRTGKTALMQQYILAMPEEEKAKTAYLHCNADVDMLEIENCLDALIEKGFDTFFLDEITCADDFQAYASSLSDHYATNFGRIVLAGTDSLGIRLASTSQLFDRTCMIHTSHIPYAEYARLLGIDSIEEYIAYGGLLTKEYYQNGVLREEYLNTSIVDNILNSLIDAGEHRRYFNSLATRFDHEEIRSVINRMINKFSYNVVLKSLNKRFKSAPLSVTLNTASMEAYRGAVDQETVNARVREAAKILEPAEMKTSLTPTDLEAVKKYLEELDLLLRVPSTLSVQKDAPVGELQILLQPGMVYSHSIYLTEQLAAKQSWRKEIAKEDRDAFIARTDEFVRGEILESIVLSETFLALRRREGLGNRYYVSQLSVHRGQSEVPYSGSDAEADLLVMDWNKKETCVFEVKHSEKYVKSQSKNLRKEAFLKYIAENFYPVKHRAVIYRGCSGIDEDGIIYLNAEEYLKNVDALRKKEQPEFSDTIFSARELPVLKEGAAQEAERTPSSGYSRKVQKR